jgi:hypothetical protein
MNLAFMHGELINTLSVKSFFAQENLATETLSHGVFIKVFSVVKSFRLSPEGVETWFRLVRVRIKKKIEVFCLNLQTFNSASLKTYFPKANWPFL